MSNDPNDVNFPPPPQTFPPTSQNFPPPAQSFQPVPPQQIPVAYNAAPPQLYQEDPASAIAGPAKVLGILFIVLAVLGFLGAFFIGTIIALIPSTVTTDGVTQPTPGGALPAGALLIASVFVALLAGVLPLMTGIGLMTRKPWGRVLAIVNSALILISIPFGTLLGGFTLYFMLRTGAKQGWDRLTGVPERGY